MKRLTTTLLFIALAALFTTSARAGDAPPPVSHVKIPVEGGAPSSGSPRARLPQAAPAEARQALARIIQTHNLEPNYRLMEARMDNAIATIDDGERVIVYDPAMFERIGSGLAATHRPWVFATIIAHEIGHHLNGDTIEDQAHPHATELAADHFAGATVRRLGGEAEAAAAVIGVLADVEGSSTHPPRHLRLDAARRGWREADAQIAFLSGASDAPPERPDYYRLPGYSDRAGTRDASTAEAPSAPGGVVVKQPSTTAGGRAPAPQPTSAPQPTRAPQPAPAGGVVVKQPTDAARAPAPRRPPAPQPATAGGVVVKQPAASF